VAQWARRDRCHRYEAVSYLVDESEKEGVTVIAEIDATGTKLPLTVIGKGKTKRCLTGLNLPPEVWNLVSPSGSTTTDVMSSSLRLLHENLYPTGPLTVLSLECSRQVVSLISSNQMNHRHCTNH
jgi:hypothetical protein